MDNLVPCKICEHLEGVHVTRFINDGYVQGTCYDCLEATKFFNKLRSYHIYEPDNLKYLEILVENNV